MTVKKLVATLSVALVIFLIFLAGVLIVKRLDAQNRAGGINPAKVGPAVMFEPKENVVRAEFDNQVRIVIVPTNHCVTYEPKNVVEVVTKTDRTVKIKVQQKATVIFRKVPLSDPKCQL